MIRPKLVSLLTALALASCASTDGHEENKTKTRLEPPQPVYKVDQVDLTVLSRSDTTRRVRIHAVGHVRSGGWSGPQLVEVTSAASDRAVYKFVARPPAGPATAAITSIQASRTVKLPRYALDGIVVQSETNTRAAWFSGSR